MARDSAKRARARGRGEALGGCFLIKTRLAASSLARVPFGRKSLTSGCRNKIPTRRDPRSYTRADSQTLAGLILRIERIPKPHLGVRSASDPVATRERESRQLGRNARKHRAPASSAAN
jgi:hypothetical protein